MNSSPLFFLLFCACIQICLAGDDNLQDLCPTASTGKQTVFINGFPCKNPANINGSDFKSSKLNQAGDTDNFYRSSVTIVTAADFTGLNTLGLSIARTDLEVDGLVMPHAHPRATELFFVYKGDVLAGFLDTENRMFQKVLKAGDVIVFPRGLLHYCINAGFEAATIYSVLNSQNPGVVSIVDALFEPDPNMINKLMKKLVSVSALDVDHIQNVTLAKFLQSVI